MPEKPAALALYYGVILRLPEMLASVIWIDAIFLAAREKLGVTRSGQCVLSSLRVPQWLSRILRDFRTSKSMTDIETQCRLLDPMPASGRRSATALPEIYSAVGSSDSKQQAARTGNPPPYMLEVHSTDTGT